MDCNFLNKFFIIEALFAEENLDDLEEHLAVLIDKINTLKALNSQTEDLTELNSVEVSDNYQEKCIIYS